MIDFSHARTPSQSLQEYGRGLAGGLIFSMPLLFTMEVWWAGFILHPLRILLYVLATFCLLLMYNRFVGLRKDASFLEVVIDSVEEMGIGILVAAVVLWITDRLNLQMTATEIGGKIIMEAMTVAIGVSVGTAQLGAPDDGDDGVAGDREGERRKAYLPQTSIALCGAVLFAANIAPTDEIGVIAMESAPWKLLLMVGCGLGLSSLILHFTDFRGAAAHTLTDTVCLKARGVTTTYAVALVAAISALWFFGKLDGQPAPLVTAMTVVLSVPAALGASAGRFLLQTGGSAGKDDPS
ncbi:TIGR02587 family membrane protein [Luteolibacter sp. SL250]|uniref:TIGR02587 family membrane protein n=1 Tax=Luteolibacter sp. SL250 TaxID=2995170 RepID=UPI0022716526|nr:TIGR02587 family membrane protein [Luteolibacter sp. SL250]WAC21467.1 TIGR02587 family membrane protein [Luteolibacter sp. SL250]